MAKINKQAQNTKDQIENTLLMLFHHNLVRLKKNVHCQANGQELFLTWDNHTSGRHNAGNAFTTLDQYTTIYDTGAYHAILHDGSIIRVSFRFRQNKLLEESLLYWPAPIVIPEEEIYELGICEAIDMYISSQNSKSKGLRMRTPIRLDFDSANDTRTHPAAHLHMQHADCRISVKEPYCFNTFIRFIFENFYPDIQNKALKTLQPLSFSSEIKPNNDAMFCIYK